MDLKSFYRKIDVDGIKNKLPPLPQIKIPKIKSRKIFKSSREDLAQQQQQQQPSPAKSMGVGLPISPQSLPANSGFIDRTPTRISTVSSLMNINYGFKDKPECGLSTYRTASNFEEENCPDEFDTREPAGGNKVSRFSDRCKKTYKDFSEFKIKDIFVKKTVVRRTEIEVDIYARQYERDLHLEEDDLENRVEEHGYKFEFKEARRRLSVSSNSISPPDSVRSGVPSPIRSELGHLQRNETPPLLAKRRNAISEAATLRKKFQRSMSEDSTDEPPMRPIRSSLWTLNEKNNPAESGEEQAKVHRIGVSRLSKFKQSMKDSISADSADDQPAAHKTGTSRMARFKKSMKDGISESFLDRNAPAESENEQPQAPPNTSRMARFKKSMKDGISEGFSEKHIPAESENDQPQPQSLSRMARFKKSMKEGISEGFSDRNIPAESENDQPQAPSTSRMARFKKSMKDGISEGFPEKHIPAESENDQSQPQSLSRMARFKKSMKEGISEGFSDKHIPAESENDQPQAPSTSRMAKFKKSMKEGISEGFSDRHNPAESGDTQHKVHKAGPSRMAKFKKSMKEGISEGFSDRNIPAESENDQPQAPSTSRMARFKKSMKEGISEGFSDKHIPAESGDDQPQTHKAGPSRMARFKKSMKEGISEGFSDRNIHTASGDDNDQPPAHKAAKSRNARSKKTTNEGLPDKYTSAESEDDHDNNRSGTSRIARIKKSMKGGMSESFVENDIPEESGDDDQPKGGESRMARFKKTMKEGISHDFAGNSDSTWNLKNIRNRFTSEDNVAEQKPKKNLQSQESLDEPSDHEKKSWKLSNIHLRRSEPQEKSNDPTVISSPEGKFSSIKMSINRLKNRRPQRQTSEESENEQNDEYTKPNMSEQLKAGLRKLKLKERSFTFDEEETKTPKEPPITSRISKWKKSIKIKRTIEPTSEDDGSGVPSEAPPPPPPGRSQTLMRKLNHIRSRKVVSDDADDSGDPSQTSDQQKQKSSNMEKLEQARTKALQKVNAQMQKMKNFHGKSKDVPDETTSPEKRSGKIQKSDSVEQSDLEMEDSPKAAAVAWRTNQDNSQSMESEDDEDEKIPKVLIHQNDSDEYESTLVIAVTRPAPPVPTAVVKEIIPKIKYQAPKTEWIPNKSAISSFLEMTPSPEASSQHLDVNRSHHLRKRSMDSNDSDSWIPENFRNKSCSSSTLAGLNKISENAEPWKVHTVFSQEKLYKTKSIDIFANREGGAFRDFDDEMKNVPVRRIMGASADSLDKNFGDSTDDDDDYDNASRITRLKQESPMISTKVAIETIRSGSGNTSSDSNKAHHGSPVPKKAQIGNSQESLDANYDENDELSSEEEEDDDEGVPTMAPSPPPSFSPPPPPLPSRKPPRLLPERNDSMVRLAHPLVKQGSLRRHFSEEIEPSDLGKVNKLITRFEKNPTYENVPRIQLIPSDDDDGSYEVEEVKAIKTIENGAKKQMSSSADSDSFEKEEKKDIQIKESGAKKRHPRNRTTDDEGNYEPKKVTRTSSKRRPAPIPNQTAKIEVPKCTKNNNNNNDNKTTREQHATPSADFEYHENLDNVSIQSPNSIYGSPIGSICLSERISTSSEYGSPIGGAYQTKTMNQLRSNRRLSNRSSLRDDDTFYSFESDEENNFYSLGDTSDMRYVIEI